MYEYVPRRMSGLGAVSAVRSSASTPYVAPNRCGTGYQLYGSRSEKDDARCYRSGCRQTPNQIPGRPGMMWSRAPGSTSTIRFCCPNGSYPLTHPVGGMYGLGSLGFSEAWQRPMSTEVVRAPSCGDVSGGRTICAAPSEQSYMSAQGCRSTSYQGQDGCITSSKVNGDLWCCPAGRPAGTGAAPIQQVGVTAANIRALQTWINQQSGCSAGTVDGVYGPATRTGLLCAVAATSWVNVTGRFPFVNTLITDPTGVERPANMVFDPGTTAKTPEQSGVRTSGGGGGGAVVQQEQPPQVTPPGGFNLASIFGALPWWGWLGIAGGVGLLTVLGVAIAKSGEVEEPERPKYSGGSELDTLRD